MFFSAVDNDLGIIEVKQQSNYVTIQRSGNSLKMNDQFILVCFWNLAVNEY